MSPIATESVGVALVGVVVAFAGYLIKYRNWTFLVAGYDDSVDVPEDAVADMAGNTVLRVGIAVVAYGALIAADLASSTLELLFGAAVVAAVVRLIYRLNTYDASPA